MTVGVVSLLGVKQLFLTVVGLKKVIDTDKLLLEAITLNSIVSSEVIIYFITNVLSVPLFCAIYYHIKPHSNLIVSPHIFHTPLNTVEI
jgi:hypothetical protein